jgi:hypothetical protein
MTPPPPDKDIAFWGAGVVESGVDGSTGMVVKAEMRLGPQMRQMLNLSGASFAAQGIEHPINHLCTSVLWLKGRPTTQLFRGASLLRN